MKIFFGGQIKNECEGELAAIVSVNSNENAYATYVAQPDSEQFRNLTGLRALSYPLARIYIGISRPIGEVIASKTNSKKTEEVDLKELDELVVDQYFIKNDINPTKQKRIILELVEDKYVVIDNR